MKSLTGTVTCDRRTARRPSMIGAWLSEGGWRELSLCDVAILLIFFHVDLIFLLRAAIALLVATFVETISVRLSRNTKVGGGEIQDLA